MTVSTIWSTSRPQTYVENRFTAVGKKSWLFFSRPLCLSCFDSFSTDFKAKHNDRHMNIEVSIATKTRLFITAAPKIWAALFLMTAPLLSRREKHLLRAELN